MGEAAAFLGMTPFRVRSAIARGEMTVVRNVNGRLEGIYERDAQDWLARHRVEATPVDRRQARRDVDDRMQKLMPPPSERVFS